MKILSYNVMSGGFDGYDYETKVPPRLELIRKIVKQSSAEIVSLVDSFRWEELYSNKQLKGIFGYKHAYCINLGDARLKKLGHNNGITVLSNLAETKFKTINLKTRECVLTEVATNDFKLKVYSLYLDDLSEDTRLEQISALSQYLNNTAPSIIVGDLNTFSPRDVSKNQQRIAGFLRRNPKFTDLKGQLDEMARAEVISKLFDLGFKDSAKGFKSTFPTKLTKISDEPILRIDYCLTKKCASKSFSVIDTTLSDKTSDHYPILVEL